MKHENITRQQGRAEVAEEIRVADAAKSLAEVTKKLKQEQESKQELTHYYQNIITLKSGVQIEILTTKFYDEIEYSALDDMMVIDGFIKNPLLVKKTIKIDRIEIAAFEIITDPCIAQVIPWPETESISEED